MKTQQSFEEFMRENPDFLAISHSQIESWDQCQRKWHYTSMHKLATEVTWPMKFSGMMLHPALSRWYKSNGMEQLDSKAWAECWQEYMRIIGPIPCPRGKQAIYSKNHANEIVHKYTEMYYKDFAMYRFVASEEKRWKVLPDMKVVYLSIPDLVLQRIGDDKIIVNDFKHSTWNANTMLEVFDRQLLGQAFVTDAEYIMKTHIFSSVTLSRNYGAETFCEITRSFNLVEKDQMQEWLDEVCQTASEIIRAKENNVFVKQAPHGCFAYAKKCEFTDLCSLGSARSYMIDTMPKRERD